MNHCFFKVKKCKKFNNVSSPNPGRHAEPKRADAQALKERAGTQYPPGLLVRNFISELPSASFRSRFNPLENR